MNRPLPTRDVMVERSLIGRAPDRISLATALNILATAGRDRVVTERNLRQGVAYSTAKAGYRVVPEHVDPTWEAPKETP